MNREQNLKKFKKGESGNPNGRPKGAFSITNLIKEKLEECPNNKDKKTYADLIVQKILSKATKEGDTRMIEKVWAYMDGLPKETKELSGSISLNFDKSFKKKK